MKSLNIEFKELFESNESNLSKPTVADIWANFKHCCKMLKVDNRVDIGMVSFIAEICLYDENPTLGFTFYFHMIKSPEGNDIDNNDSYVCTFDLKGISEISNLDSEHIEFGDIDGSLEDNFKEIENWSVYKIFKDKQLSYDLNKVYGY
jgi:hypothetical protein